MEQLVYISTSRTEPSIAIVHDILESSRRNNRRDFLTGVLVVGGRRYLQVLEGPAEAIDAAYRRIKADTRHYALVELARKPIAKRNFGDWDMGYEDGAAEPLREIVARLTARLEDPYLRAEIEGFAALHATA